MLTSPPSESDGSLQNIFDQLRELYARELRVQVFRPACATLPCFYLGRPHGARGERRIFLIISFSPEGKVYRLLAGARGFFAPTCSSAALIAAMSITAKKVSEFR